MESKNKLTKVLHRNESVAIIDTDRENSNPSKKANIMAKFNKKANVVILQSNGSFEDGLKVAKWARNLVEKCDAVVVDAAQGRALAAAHLDCAFAPEILEIQFSNYYSADMSFWLAHCKK